MSYKNKEWLEGDKEEINYHIRQYQKPKKYTKYLFN